VHAGDLHRLVDDRRADIERAAEDVRETQRVVDLVRIVRTARRDDRVLAHGARFFRKNLRRRIGEREDDRPLRHARDHVRLEHAWRGQAEEHVGAVDDLAEFTRVRLARVAALVRVHFLLAAFPDHAEAIGDPDVLRFHAEADQHVETGDARRARAGRDELDLRNVLAGDVQRVDDRRADDDRGAVLVVVEDRDLHALAQLLLDFEALGRLDVLEVDAAETRLEAGDDVDELVRIVLGDFEIEHVDAGEFLEQHALAFHHGLRRERADVAEAEHSGAVGDDRDEVAARGDRGHFRRIAHDLLARGGDAGRVRERVRAA
jgi:hypothetical protein